MAEYGGFGPQSSAVDQWLAWAKYGLFGPSKPPAFGDTGPIGPRVGGAPVPQETPPAGPEAARIPVPQDPFPGYSFGGLPRPGGGAGASGDIFSNLPYIASGGSPYMLQLPQRPDLPAFRPPQYPTAPVPQMGAPEPFDRSKIDAAYAQAKPKPYEQDKNQRMLAFLAGALGGYDNRPGDRFGTILGRIAGGGAKGLYGDTLSQKEQERQSERELRQYYANQAGLERQLENTRLNRSDRAQQTQFQNETNTREDAFRKGEFDLRVQQLQRQFMIQGYDMDTARALAEWGAHIQSRQVGALEGRSAAAMVSAAQRGRRAQTIDQMEPGAAISTIIGRALTKKEPIPGLDLARLQQESIAELNNDPNFRTTMDPTLKSQMVTQRTIAKASQTVAANPQLMQGMLQMYRGVPLGYSSGGGAEGSFLGGFDPYE